MDLPIIYSFRRCPYAMRARLAIAYNTISCELREVVLKDKPQALLTISPKATVPVLQLTDGTVIDESLEIIQWVLRQSASEQWLTPLTNYEKQLTFKLIQYNDGEFKTALDKYKYADRFPEYSEQHYRQQGEIFLTKLEQLLMHNGCLLKDKWTLADIAILPFIRQFRSVDAAWFDKAPYPQLIAWLHTFLDSELFETIMPKYEQWHAGDPLITFPMEATNF